MIQDKLINLFIDNKNKEEALLLIFELLKEYIPFERIRCNKIDREEKVLTSFVEYNLIEAIQERSFKLKKIIPSSVFNTFVENSSNIIMKNITPNDELFDYYSQFPFSVNSVLFFPLPIDLGLNKKMFFICLSSQKDAFTQEHIDILKIVRPYLEKILYELYFNKPEANFFLNSSLIFPNSAEELLRQCPDLASVMEKIKVIAPHNITVLINGPTGSGKELVAQATHALSSRANKAFIPVNCSAIPDTLIESELFGYEKGAFTGANNNKRGYFEQANLGTIFLDEIGELSLLAQARLLRVLETSQIQKIGSEKIINTDIRIITATHRNLLEMVKTGEFREDLYYRIKGFLIEIPPLEKRKRDIKILSEYFYSQAIQKFQIKNPPRISYETIYSLADYSLQGNVRELKTIIEEGIFNAIVKKQDKVSFSKPEKNLHKTDKREKLTKEEIMDALKSTNWKIQGKNSAAELLNVNHSTLRSRMRTLKIPFKNNTI